MNNQYADIELCKKFVEMGMKSRSGFYYCGGCPEDLRWLQFNPSDGDHMHREYDGDIQAFHPWDIIANTEQAKKNREILWPDRNASSLGLELRIDPNMPEGVGPYFVNSKLLNDDTTTNYTEYHRHKALDAPDFWEYVKQTMKG